MYIEPRLPNSEGDIWTANLKSRIVHCVGTINEESAESNLIILLKKQKLQSG